MKEIYSKSSVVGWPANEAPVFTRDFQDQSGWLHADGREGRARGSLEPSGSLGGFRVPGSACVPCLCCLPTTGVLAYGSLICTSGPVLCPGGRGNRELRKYFSVLGEWLAIYLCCLPGPRAELSKWLGCNVLQACLRLCSGDHSPRLPSHLRRGVLCPHTGCIFWCVPSGDGLPAAWTCSRARLHPSVHPPCVHCISDSGDGQLASEHSCVLAGLFIHTHTYTYVFFCGFMVEGLGVRWGSE